MTVASAFKKFAIISVILCAAVSGVIVFFAAAPAHIFLIAYVISFIFTGSNFFLMSKINIAGNKTFFSWFAVSFAVRFLGALIAVIAGVMILNLYKIFFTVSFLFSYLCHSSIEIIYLNKILKTDS